MTSSALKHAPLTALLPVIAVGGWALATGRGAPRGPSTKKAEP